MLIGKMEFSAGSLKKPLMISPEGKFITVQQVAESPALGRGSLFSLSEDLQMKLAIERYSHESDFSLGVIGVGLYTRDEIIENIRKRTEFGILATKVEMGYCSELAGSITRRTIPSWPKVPIKPIQGNGMVETDPEVHTPKAQKQGALLRKHH